jgi:HK97 family phage major capsid protein
MPSLDYSALLAEANDLLHRSVPLTKESTARAATLIQLAEAEYRRQSLGKHSRELGLTSAEPTDAHEIAFRNYLASGKVAINSGTVDKRYLVGSQGEFRNAQGSGSDAVGGVLAPEPFSDRVQAVIAQYDPIYDLAAILETSTGDACVYPVIDDSGEEAAVKAENAASDTNKDLVFGNAALPVASTYRSGMLIVPWELLQDSFFNIDNIVEQAFGRRFAKQIGADFTGIIIGDSGSPVAVTSSSPSALTDGEVWSLIESLDDAYAVNASFVMRKSTFSKIAQIKGTSGNYVFDVDRDSAGRMTLQGFPVFFSASMPAIGGGNKVVAFGDFQSGFVKRVVRGSLTIKRFNETYAVNGAAGFQGWIRVSGALVKGAVTRESLRVPQSADKLSAGWHTAPQRRVNSFHYASLWRCNNLMHIINNKRHLNF